MTSKEVADGFTDTLVFATLIPGIVVAELRLGDDFEHTSSEAWIA